MSADTLTASSRNFFERTKSKVAISIIVSAAALLTLGFCSSSGGVSSAYGDYSKVSGIDSDIKDGYGAMQAGFGFAAFLFILAFILLLAASIYISPFFCGSANEKKMIRSPQEIDSGYSAYTENPSASHPPQV